MNPPSADDYTGMDALLYEYLMSDNDQVMSPLPLIDEEPVFYAAEHGPRSEDEAQYILESPRLVELLADLWSAEPPSGQAKARFRASGAGARLLAGALSNSAPLGTLEGKEGESHPRVADRLHLEVELYLLTVSQTSSAPNRGSSQSANVTGAQSWIFTTETAGGAEPLTLRVTHKPHAVTGVMTLYVELSEADSLRRLGASGWTLRYSNSGGAWSNLLEDQQLIEPFQTAVVWAIPTEHAPDEHTKLTLTPVEPQSGGAGGTTPQSQFAVAASVRPLSELPKDSGSGSGEVLSGQQATDFVTDVELFLLSTEERSAAPMFRGLSKRSRPSTVWVYSSDAPDGIRLEVSQHANADSKEPELRVKLEDSAVLTQGSDSSWRLVVRSDAASGESTLVYAAPAVTLGSRSHTWSVPTELTPPSLAFILHRVHP